MGILCSRKVQCSLLLKFHISHRILDSIVVSIPACHAGDRGSIPRRGGSFCSAINLCYSCNERRWKRSWTFSCKPYSFTKIVLVQNSMFNDTLVNFLFVVYMTQIRMSLCSRIKDSKQQSPPGGLEPPTFRLTAERASRLRHGGLLAKSLTR